MKSRAHYFFGIISLIFFLSCKKKITHCEDLQKGNVCIIVKNRSENNIRKITVTHERGKSEILNLLEGDESSISFYSPGENTYKIKVDFESGKILESNEDYVEGGYRMTEIIYPDKIEKEEFDLY